MNDGGIEEKQEEENHAKSRDEGNKRRQIAKGDVTSITYIHTYITYTTYKYTYHQQTNSPAHNAATGRCRASLVLPHRRE